MNSGNNFANFSWEGQFMETTSVSFDFSRGIKISSYLIFISVFIFSCSPKRYVTFNSVRPAQITFSKDINSFLIVDRTGIENKNVNIIEGILTGERPGDDKRAVEDLISGLQENIGQSDRFQSSVFPDRLSADIIPSTFPSPIPWNKIEEMASEHQADMIIAIELFDSDFAVNDSKRIITRVINNKEVPVPEFLTAGNGRITIGFRIYDPIEHRIVDQDMMEQNHHWESSGPNPIAARRDLIQRGAALRFISLQAARMYTAKLIPTTVRVRREFYKKKRSVPEMAVGTRYADVNNWEKSVEVWSEGLAKERGKNAGKLAYNIAVAYEVLGDLEEAMNWANKAYVEYNNKKAGDYHRTLKYRINEQEILNEQLIP